MKVHDDKATASPVAISIGRILGGVLASAATAVGAYLALSRGLGTLVFVLFGIGLLYFLWAGIETLLRLGAPATPAPEPEENIPAPAAPPELAEIRRKVMNEVIWGNFDPEVKALAEALAGPDAPFAEHYIELRVTQLRGSAPKDEAKPPDAAP